MLLWLFVVLLCRVLGSCRVLFFRVGFGVGFCVCVLRGLSCFLVQLSWRDRVRSVGSILCGCCVGIDIPILLYRRLCVVVR